MAEGCAAASVLGMLEEREAAARVRVEGLREEAARLAEVLETAEIELDLRKNETFPQRGTRRSGRNSWARAPWWTPSGHGRAVPCFCPGTGPS
ncbi:hypothetical protein E6W17_35450 [Streptomyces sp. A1547]|nr:hypothetical protein E6W17_35450 [Streptomyces sp. A1547]